MVETNISKVLDSFSKGWVEAVSVEGHSLLLHYGITIGLITDKLAMILDGCSQGHVLNIKDNEKIVLVSDVVILTRQDLKLTFFKEKGELVFPSGERYLTEPNHTISSGEYLIELPRFPHVKACDSSYLQETNGGSRFAETWFELLPVRGKRKGIFLHFGLISSGCVTVSARLNKPMAWSEIYMRLMRNRITSLIAAKLVVL